MEMGSKPAFFTLHLQSRKVSEKNIISDQILQSQKVGKSASAHLSNTSTVQGIGVHSLY
jgi:hypothetical protein